MKRTENSLRDLWDNIKHTNIQVTEVQKEEKEKKGCETIFEEIIVENFPNLEKEIVNQVQEAQRVTYRISPRRNRPRHILTKLTKTKHRKNIKSSKGAATRSNKGEVTYKGNPIHYSAGQKGMAGYISSTDREKSTTKSTIPGKDLIQN